jgi:membrane associated rhomboid family serine protease
MDKKIFQSKTFWIQVLALVAVMVPASAGFITEHLGASGAVWALVNVALRLITKDKVQII